MIKARLISTVIIFTFLFNSIAYGSSSGSQEMSLPASGAMVHLSPAYNPPVLKGIKIHPDNPFEFEFVLDVGAGLAPAQNTDIKSESTKLIKYFLTSLTVPEKDLWVNLSPYEKNRIVPVAFGQTEMGRDLLAQDYMLKQLTASLIYPENEIGKKFWKRVYEEAAKRFGNTKVPVNTFNKVWIMPDKAVVYENVKAGTAYVVESRLKVMLEEDYLAYRQAGLSLTKNTVGAGLVPAQNNDDVRVTARVAPTDINQLGSKIVREIVLPALYKEINTGQNFAQLRQVYNSLILAQWYKKKIKDSILNQVYANKNKIKGTEYSSSVIPAEAGIQPKMDARLRHSDMTSGNDVELIYQHYLQAFKKGAYNFIKEEQDPISRQMIPRKYFSGGIQVTNLSSMAMTTTHEINPAQLDSKNSDHYTISMRLDAAMNANRFTAIVLDDEKVEIDKMRKALEAKGFRVLAFQSCETALKKLADKKIKADLIVSDFQFGENKMNGKEFFERVKDISTLSNVYFILRSAVVGDIIGASEQQWRDIQLETSPVRGGYYDELVWKLSTRGLEDAIDVFIEKASKPFKKEISFIDVRVSYVLEIFFMTLRNNTIAKDKIKEYWNGKIDEEELMSFMKKIGMNDQKHFMKIVNKYQVAKVILFVEDRRGDRDRSIDLLNHQGHIVIASASVDSALGRLTKGDRPDAIVSDFNFGEGQKDGRVFFETLQSKDQLKDIPFVLISAIFDLAREHGTSVDHLINPKVGKYSAVIDKLQMHTLPEVVKRIFPADANAAMIGAGLLRRFVNNGRNPNQINTFPMNGGATLLTRASNYSFVMSGYAFVPSIFANDPNGFLIRKEGSGGWLVENTSFEVMDNVLKIIQRIERQDQERLDKTSPIIYIDLGCGNGRALVELQKILQKKEQQGKGIANVQLYGFANEMYPEWRKRVPGGIHLIMDTIDHLKDYFEPASVSLMGSYFGIEHLFDDLHATEFARSAFRDLRNLLKKNGEIVLSSVEENERNLLKDILPLKLIPGTYFASGSQIYPVEFRQDSAMKPEEDKLGGIDLSSDKALTVQKDSKSNGPGIQFRLDPAQLSQWQESQGVIVDIIEIKLMTDIRSFLGVSK